MTSYRAVWDPKMYCSIEDLNIKGYRCVRRKTIVLCFKMVYIGTNKVKHIIVLIVLKSGSLNLLEHSRPVQACNGIAYIIVLTRSMQQCLS
jgi:hypothetical protein